MSAGAAQGYRNQRAAKLIFYMKNFEFPPPQKKLNVLANKRKFNNSISDDGFLRFTISVRAAVIFTRQPLCLLVSRYVYSSAVMSTRQPLRLLASRYVYSPAVTSTRQPLRPLASRYVYSPAVTSTRQSLCLLARRYVYSPRPERQKT